MLKEEYGRWLDRAVADPDVAAELKAMAGNEDEIKECFWQDLEFGTGGLRGVIGAGTNRLNIYTIGKAPRGLPPTSTRRIKTAAWLSLTTAV